MAENGTSSNSSLHPPTVSNVLPLGSTTATATPTPNPAATVSATPYPNTNTNPAVTATTPPTFTGGSATAFAVIADPNPNTNPSILASATYPTTFPDGTVIVRATGTYRYDDGTAIRMDNPRETRLQETRNLESLPCIPLSTLLSYMKPSSKEWPYALARGCPTEWPDSAACPPRESSYSAPIEPLVVMPPTVRAWLDEQTAIPPVSTVDDDQNTIPVTTASETEINTSEKEEDDHLDDKMNLKPQ